MMKILSIDWDYFVGADEMERCALMPDGGNEHLPWGIQSTVWVNHYVNHQELGQRFEKLQHENLQEIQVRRMELIDLRTLLSATVTKATRVYIAESHADIFNPLKAMTREFTEEFEIVNIDHHHDCWQYGTGTPVDCGNWLARVIEQSHDNAHVTWVRNEDSKPWELDDLNIATIRQIDHHQRFNMVFLCRSGMWSPPHLDKHFLVLSKYLNKQCKGNAIHTAPTTKEDRWSKTFRNNVKYLEHSMVTALAQHRAREAKEAAKPKLQIVLNPDEAKRAEVQQAVKDNDGYCPCQFIKTPDTKCMCKEFREQDIPGLCHCQLYLKQVKE